MGYRRWRRLAHAVELLAAGVLFSAVPIAAFVTSAYVPLFAIMAAVAIYLCSWPIHRKAAEAHDHLFDLDFDLDEESQ